MNQEQYNELASALSLTKVEPHCDSDSSYEDGPFVFNFVDGKVYVHFSLECGATGSGFLNALRNLKKSSSRVQKLFEKQVESVFQSFSGVLEENRK